MTAKKQTKPKATKGEKPKRKRGSDRPTYAEGIKASTGGELTRFKPSDIRSHHAENQRFAPYDAPAEIAKWLVPPGVKYEAGMRVSCCFKLATIEKRLNSLLEFGQIEPVKVSISGTKHPDIMIGNLRLCAFLLAEARGLLDKIPGAKGQSVTGIKAIVVVKRAESAADRDLVARLNREENLAREELSPIDSALFFKRELSKLDDNGQRKTIEQVAAEEGRHVDYVRKHLQLMKNLTDAQVLAVHEGTLPYTKALKLGSAAGRGSGKGARGDNPGVARGSMKRAVQNVGTRPSPMLGVTRDQLVEYTARLAGVEPAEGEKTDPLVERWAAWANADKSVGKKPKKVKALPPKPKAAAVNGDAPS